MSLDRPHKNSSIARARAVKADTFSIIANALHKVQARQIVDFGCGYGEMAARLAADGFDVTGVDPSAESIEQARKSHQHLSFIEGTAEQPPLEVGSFDAAYFLNSLHHVPPADMQQAVMAAATIVRPGGLVLVIEPLAAGSFFRAMRPVEDESEIRALAAHAVDMLIGDGTLKLVDLQRWDRESKFQSLEDFTEYLLRVDPQRSESIHKNSVQLAKAWRENVTIRENSASLSQPLVCWILTRR